MGASALQDAAPGSRRFERHRDLLLRRDLGLTARQELGAEMEIVATFDGWTKLPGLRNWIIGATGIAIAALLAPRLHSLQPAVAIVLSAAALALVIGMSLVVTAVVALAGVRQLVVVLSRQGYEYDTLVFDADTLGRPAGLRLHVPASKPGRVGVRGRFVGVDIGADEVVWLSKSTARDLGIEV
jgi:hypothetical protein